MRKGAGHMDVAYKREWDKNYLVIEQEEFQESYQVEMLLRNSIPGFLPCRLSLIDTSASFYYEITSRQSLRLLLERKRLCAEELHRLLEGMKRALATCGEYLLDSDRLLLDPDYIYLDPDAWEVFFCFFPFESGDMQEKLMSLAEYLLEHLDRQDQNAVTLGYELYRTASEGNASLEQVLLKWEKERRESRYEEEEPQTEQVAEHGSYGERQTAKHGSCGEKQAAEHGRCGEERTMETVWLSSRRKDRLVLKSRNRDYPDLEMQGESFLIGKKKDAVDGLLKARGISRIHGKLTKEGEEYYLTDLNSTNGTYLNGGRLEVNEKARIHEGDLVGFAGVEYIVEM
jgi:hypothetical protein